MCGPDPHYAQRKKHASDARTRKMQNFLLASPPYPPSLPFHLPSHETTRQDMKGWIGGYDHAQKMHHVCCFVCRLSVCLLSCCLIPSLPLKSPHSKPACTQKRTRHQTLRPTQPHIFPSRSLPPTLAQSLSLLSLSRKK